MAAVKRTKNYEPSDMLEKAKRVIAVRKFARLTREDMNVRHKIHPSTLRGWESPGSMRNQGLTQKGAERIVRALQKEGVACSVQWLMEGSGVGPHFITNPLDKSSSEGKKKNALWGEHLVINNEIKFFEENNSDSVVLMISDNGLDPFFNAGEYVGGIKKYSKDIDNCINKFCIVETSDSEMFIRKLLIGKKPKTYSLSCINPHTTSSEPVLYDLKLNWAAPIIWYRKHDR